jgi:hypothetical protein
MQHATKPSATFFEIAVSNEMQTKSGKKMLKYNSCNDVMLIKIFFSLVLTQETSKKYVSGVIILN